jgi:hypothetical protein
MKVDSPSVYNMIDLFGIKLRVYFMNVNIRVGNYFDQSKNTISSYLCIIPLFPVHIVIILKLSSPFLCSTF